MRAWRLYVVLGVFAAAGCAQILGLHELPPADAHAEAADAAADAVTPDGSDDRDGDGIPDSLDNCPDVKNHDQANEDGDKFGDVCDPCPPIADDNPIDSDGDGVADACDPHPATKGDRILLFEGFHTGIPPGWTASGTWLPVGDSVEADDLAGNGATLSTPVPMNEVGALAISTSVQLGGVEGGSNDNSFFGTVGPYDPVANAGVYCDAFESGPGLNQTLNIYDSTNMNGPSRSVAFGSDETLEFTQVWDDHAFICDATGSNGTAEVKGSDMSTYSSDVGVSLSGVNATIPWVMLVDQGGSGGP